MIYSPALAVAWLCDPPPIVCVCVCVCGEGWGSEREHTAGRVRRVTLTHANSFVVGTEESPIWTRSSPKLQKHSESSLIIPCFSSVLVVCVQAFTLCFGSNLLFHCQYPGIKAGFCGLTLHNVIEYLTDEIRTVHL